MKVGLLKNYYKYGLDHPAYGMFDPDEVGIFVTTWLAFGDGSGISLSTEDFKRDVVQIDLDVEEVFPE